MRAFAIAVLMGALLAGGCARLPQRKVGPLDIEEPVLTSQVLPNGLTLYHKYTPYTDIVTIDMWVASGSRDETEATSGIAHYLEHMLFKGTETRGVGELDRQIEGVGGVWNAGTSQDFTHFHVTLGAEYFDIGLDCLADAIQHSAIDADELAREREVILQEVRRKEDTPSTLLWTLVYRTAYDEHPYRLPVLGTPESLADIGRQTIYDHYKRYYVPRNMRLVIVGGVPLGTAAPAVRRAFAALPDEPPPPSEGPAESPMEGVRRVSVEKDVRQSYLAVGFRGPSIRDGDDVYAMDVLLYILGEGRASRMYRIIREDKQLVTGIGTSFPTQRDPGLFVVTAAQQPGREDEVEAAIVEELKRIRAGAPSAEEMDRAKTLIRSHYAFETETTDDQSGLIGYYATVSGSPDFGMQYLDNIAEVTAEDVTRVAREYLDPLRYAMVTIVPAPEEAEAPAVEPPEEPPTSAEEPPTVDPGGEGATETTGAGEESPDAGDSREDG